MNSTYLPKLATIEQACAWLESNTGERWILARLLEHGLMPWFWLHYQTGWPDIFGDRREGYLAPMVFAGDMQRLEADGAEAYVTMTRTHDGIPFRVQSEGLHVPLTELRFKREDVERTAAALKPAEGEAPKQPADDDATLAELFDSVRHEQLEAMFPDGGKWASYAEKADRNGLRKAAKTGRGLFNPYRAAHWWLSKGQKDWKLERCIRVLANNLPRRSLDSKHLLTGGFE
jgi:hypothetical protein